MDPCLPLKSQLSSWWGSLIFVPAAYPLTNESHAELISQTENDILKNGLPAQMRASEYKDGMVDLMMLDMTHRYKNKTTTPKLFVVVVRSRYRMTRFVP
jgi:hypothetical protein